MANPNPITPPPRDPTRKRKSRKEYDVLRLAFIEWLANPESQGTQQDFARQHDIDDGTLSDWKNEEGFWDRVWNRFTDFYLQGELPAVNRTLICKAKAGDRYATELVYKVAKRITDRLELTGKEGQPLEVKIVRPEEWTKALDPISCRVVGALEVKIVRPEEWTVPQTSGWTDSVSSSEKK